jgi:hypothetical protein
VRLVLPDGSGERVDALPRKELARFFQLDRTARINDVEQYPIRGAARDDNVTDATNE